MIVHFTTNPRGKTGEQRIGRVGVGTNIRREQGNERRNKIVLKRRSEHETNGCVSSNARKMIPHAFFGVKRGGTKPTCRAKRYSGTVIGGNEVCYSCTPLRNA